jgi:tetratricopeptide (TPR) repeat protein
MLLGISLMMLSDFSPNRSSKLLRHPRIAAWVTLLAFLATSAVCISDRAMGFSVLNDSTLSIPTTGAAIERIEPLLQHVKAEPESAQAYEALGIAEYDLWQLGPAKDALENALMLNPDLKDAHYVLVLMEILNRWQQSSDSMPPIINRTYLQDAPAYVNYGLTLYSHNFRHKGFEILSDAVNRFPNDAGAHQALAMACFNDGKINQAADEIAKSLRLNSESIEVLDLMRVILRAHGESSDSIERKIDETIHPKEK